MEINRTSFKIDEIMDLISLVSMRQEKIEETINEYPELKYSLAEHKRLETMKKKLRLSIESFGE